MSVLGLSRATSLLEFKSDCAEMEPEQLSNLYQMRLELLLFLPIVGVRGDKYFGDLESENAALEEKDFVSIVICNM